MEGSKFIRKYRSILSSATTIINVNYTIHYMRNIFNFIKGISRYQAISGYYQEWSIWDVDDMVSK